MPTNTAATNRQTTTTFTLEGRTVSSKPGRGMSSNISQTNLAKFRYPSAADT